MKPWWIVVRKEVLESLRDRRTLLSALVMAPLFGPLMFSFNMVLTSRTSRCK